MKKLGIGAVLILVVAAAVGVVYLVSNLNSIVARIIEDEGSKVAATDVAVSGVDITLREGRSTIAGLRISSPDGFDGSVFSLGEITVDIDLKSLSKDPIVIEEVRVRAPEVSAQILRTGSSNVLDLQKNVNKYSASAGGGEKDADQKRIRIKRFVFEEGRIELDASDLGLEKRSVNLPSIQIDDIGGAQGARPDAIAKAVLGALTRKAVAEIAKAGLEDKARDLVTDEAKKQAEGLLDKIGK